LHTDVKGIRLLAERGEGNLLALAQDIEKLALLYPPGNIEVDDIASVISDSARFDVFILIDAAVAGDGLRVMRIMNGLKQEGTEPILVLWGIVREVRMLALVAHAIALKENKDEVLRRNGVWPRRIPLVTKALQRHDTEYWQSLLKSAYEVDKIIKGAAVGNVWDELESLVLKVAGVEL
jgi:DNA polymerase-3 subunit delta